MTPEQHADNIARWTSAGLRQAVIDEIAAAVQAEREALRECLYRKIIDSGVGLYQERSVIAETVDAAIRDRNEVKP